MILAGCRNAWRAHAIVRIYITFGCEVTSAPSVFAARAQQVCVFCSDFSIICSLKMLARAVIVMKGQGPVMISFCWRARQLL